MNLRRNAFLSGTVIITKTKTTNIINSVDDLQGLTVCITGKIGTLTRNQVFNYLKSRGIDASYTVTKQTNVLLTGKSPGKTKLDKAKSLGIRIVAWNNLTL